jgi:predicted dehydrogenase
MQPTIDALNAGCHVLVEKPLAMNAKEGEKMLAAARKNRKHLVIGFQWRYHPTVRMIRRAADEGVFGRILYVRSQAIRRRGIPNWGVFGRKELQGGGPLIDIGVHNMEMCHFIMGSPQPVTASGRVYTYMGNKPSSVECSWPNWDYKTYTVEDLAIGHITFDNGAVMHVEASFAVHSPDVWNFLIMGEKAGCQFDPPMIFRDEAGTMFNLTPAFQAKSDMFETKMRNFVNTALYDQPSPSPAEHGLMVQKMIDGIYASSESGREVEIR